MMKQSNSTLFRLNNNVILFCALFFIVGCNKKQEINKLDRYQSEFRLLTEELLDSTNIESNARYYLISGNACEPCLMLNLTMLIELEDSTNKIIPVILGSSDQINIESIYKSFILPKFEKSYFISEYNMLRYKLDISKPLLLEFQEGKLTAIENYDDFSMNEARNKLLSKI